MPQHTVLAARIRQELRQLERVAARIQSVLQSTLKSGDKTLAVESVILNMQGFYTGAERIFQMIANTVDGSLPQGAE